MSRLAGALVAWSLIAATLSGCAAPEAKAPQVVGPRVEALAHDERSAAIIAEAGQRGTFVLYDVTAEKLSASDAVLARERRSPCSTFKIPNTLIALETGVVDGEGFTLRWDGVQRPIDAWNRDHTLASAMKHSTVWYYQEIARRVRGERMGPFLERFDYGNRDMSGGIDRFWLESSLQISPLEEVVFLDKLRRRALPVKAAHAELVERITTLDQGPGWVLRGKTGTCQAETTSHAWLVGSTEVRGRAHVFALLLVGDGAATKALSEARRPLLERLLKKAGALPP